MEISTVTKAAVVVVVAAAAADGVIIKAAEEASITKAAIRGIKTGVAHSIARK